MLWLFRQPSVVCSMGHCWTKPSKKKSDVECPTAELASGNVHLVTTIEKWEEMISEANKHGKMVVVNFSATWCSPCRVVAPTYSELADKYPSIIFLTVDVDKLTEFSSTWDIKATPTFFFLKDGRQVDKFVGSNKLELQKKTIAIADSTSRH